jgi:hypothetical protein
MRQNQYNSCPSASMELALAMDALNYFAAPHLVIASNLDAQTSGSLKKPLTSLLEGLRPSVTKQFLCGLIPRTNLALMSYRES